MTATRSRPRVPHDGGLPQLATLLHADAMMPLLARWLGGTQPDEVRVRYLRYKRATRLVVTYDVSAAGANHVATAYAEPGAGLDSWACDPSNLELAGKAAPRTLAATPLGYDAELHALIQWFPLDLSMPVLADDPDWLRRRLRTLGVEVGEDGEGLELLAYKARRRAVVRLGSHVVKVYAGSTEFAGAVTGLEGAARLRDLRVPRCEAIDIGLRLTCQELIGGTTASAEEGAGRAGELAARVHAAEVSGLRPFPASAQLAAAASSARAIAGVAPELGDRLARLLRDLEERLPDAASLLSAHGDFHAGQVLDPASSPALIDFDEMCAAPAALDLSSYVAHIVDGQEGSTGSAACALDALVSGYGARPRGLAWHLATSIIRRSVFPFRLMQHDWPARTARMVAAAEAALADEGTPRPVRQPAARRYPHDDALPQLGQLLDAATMTSVLQRSVAPAATVSDVRVAYAQYKPARRLLVSYELAVDGEACEAVALAERDGDLAALAETDDNIELARRAAPRSPVPLPLAFDESLGVLIQWPPLDLRLPALAEPPERLRALLAAAGVSDEDEEALPELVHYKPRRRAVLRLGRHFIKIYADGDAFQRAVAGIDNASSLPIRTASRTAVMPELLLQAQSLVPGREPDGPEPVAETAGALLAAIHAGGEIAPRMAPAAWRLRQAIGHARTITALVPGLADVADALVRDLERSLPEDDLVPCHGDFFSRQMLELDGDFAVIDFDSTCMSPAALDHATYASSVVRIAADLPRAEALIDALCRGYGRRPDGIAWFLSAALLRRSLIPFRRQVDDWPEAIAERVEAASQALRL